MISIKYLGFYRYMSTIKTKETVRKFSRIAFLGVCLTFGQNTLADPVNDALSAYMQCLQENISLTPDAEIVVLRTNCQETYDALNAIFPEEIAAMIIEQTELDARQ
ncbi:MAG: hypothetical protein ACI90U_002637 [Pseudomonadales bacterium]|jgi:hypothetical protein